VANFEPVRDKWGAGSRLMNSQFDCSVIKDFPAAG